MLLAIFIFVLAGLAEIGGLVRSCYLHSRRVYNAMGSAKLSKAKGAAVAAPFALT